MNFQTQKKILEPLLRNSKNNNCADCSASTPTWASLDFGVFVCSNCSGAHRALGPTITRVKSATLDLWQEDWISNMLIGNQILNAYWQDDKSCYQRKPKSSSTNHDIQRYVYEKYVKKRYVRDKSVPDPLTQYKRTGSVNVENDEEKQREVERDIQKKKEEVKEKPRVAVTPKIQHKKQQNLLDFGFEQKPEVHSQPNTSPPKIAVGDMISFDLPSPANPQRGTTVVTEHGTSFTTQNSKSDFMSFEEMINSHKNPQPQPNVQNQNGMGLHHSVSSQQMNRGNLVAPPLMSTHSHPHHNMVYNQQYPNQYGNHHYAQSPQPQPNVQYQYGQHNQYQSMQGYQQKQGQAHWF